MNTEIELRSMDRIRNLALLLAYDILDRAYSCADIGLLMKPRFREEKATQAAAIFLDLRGGRMSHLKLIKLLYLMDREALVRWGRPVTFDRWVSMPHGTALSTTLNKINDETEPDKPLTYWHRYITERVDHEVSLRSPDFPRDDLSPAEEGLIEEIFGKYGTWSRWKLRDFTHLLPEWVDPHGSSLPISYADVLMAEGYSQEEVAEIEDEIASVAQAERLFVR